MLNHCLSTHVTNLLASSHGPVVLISLQLQTSCDILKSTSLTSLAHRDVSKANILKDLGNNILEIFFFAFFHNLSKKLFLLWHFNASDVLKIDSFVCH